MKKCLLLTALLSVCLSAFSQNIKFEHLSLDDGLPVSWIKTVCKDKMGFIWIGTNNGFCRYDGYSIKSYFNIVDDSTSLSSNQINKINELPDGRLMIATNVGGISIFDPRTEKFTSFFNKKGDQAKFDNIYDIEIDKNNIAWLSCEQGIISFDPISTKAKLIKPLSVSENKKNSFHSMLFDKNGTLWATSPFAGVVNIDVKTAKIVDQISFKQLKPSIKEGGTFQCNQYIEFDQEGALWVATEGLGLWVYKNKTLKNVLEQEVNHKSDYSRYFNKGIRFANNKMWVGFDGLGLGLFDTRTLKGEFIVPKADDHHSLNTATIQGIYSDHLGTVWIETYDGGLNIYNPERFKFSAVRAGNSAKGLSNRSVWSFCEDPSGKIWIGTDGGGIDILDPKNEDAGFEYIKSEPGNPNSVSSNVIKDIKRTKDGSYWFGTYLGGICKYDPKNKKFKKWLPTVPTDPKAPATNLVWSILEDSYGTFWLTCLGNGLDTLDRKTETFYHFNGNSDDTRRFTNGAAYTLYEDKKRTVWACTDGGGLYYYSHDLKKFKKYAHSTDSTSIPSNKVFGVLDDADGHFWVGTASGLCELNRSTGKFKVHKLVDGVTQPVVFCILQDKFKRLWISSSDGLFCYDVKAKSVDNYDKSDGLQGNEYKYGSSLISSDGKFYFGGSDGYDAFYPENIKRNNKKPSVHLSEILVFNKQVKPNDGSGIMNSTAEYAQKLTFNHNQSVITFRYIALNFTNSSKNQYAYRLTGFEKDWNYVGTKREVNYTNLDPGTYTFEVKASNNDGLWNDTPLMVEIVIVPPFWMTWWFKLLVAMVVISTSLGYYLNRINNLKQRQRFLEEKVEERTADLKEANMTLALKHEEILQQQEEILSQRDELEKNNKKLEAKQIEIYAAYDQINLKNAAINGSIRYGLTIQKAMLVSEDGLKKYFDSFILSRPKDIVSGDFYWFSFQKNNLYDEERKCLYNNIYFAVVDCTGHGVPGAFMSMIGNRLLNGIVNEKRILDPSRILDELNIEIVDALQQNETDNNDGMDISLVVIQQPENHDIKDRKVTFAGAKLPLIYYSNSNKKLTVLRGDRHSIGGVKLRKEKALFMQHELVLQKEDIIYISSDGLIDQCDEGRKRFGSARLYKLLDLHANEPMGLQKQRLEEELSLFMTGAEQRDDITIMGVKL